MDDTVEDKRQALLRVYSSESWSRKVAAMSDSQVIAVYLRFKRDKKL